MTSEDIRSNVPAGPCIQIRSGDGSVPGCHSHLDRVASSCIQIRSGDGSVPHSGTRFLLPFEVEAQGAPSGGNPGELHYRRAKDGDWILDGKDARRRYLTKETENVLFERATWWILDGAQEISFQMPTQGPDKKPDGRVVHGILRPPALILFEDSREDARAPLLHRGLLVLEAIPCEHPSEENTGSKNPQGSPWKLDDFLLFNELSRYWREPYDGHWKDYAPQLDSFNQPIAAFTKESRKNILRYGPFQKGEASKVFYERRWLSLLRIPLKDGQGGQQLRQLASKITTADGCFGHYADERAFVWTRALLDKQNARLIIPSDTKGKPIEDKDGMRAMFPQWVQLLNIDKPSSASMTAFERTWAADRTYRRWEHYNCYYGFTYFSAAMLATPNSDPPTWKHWSQMYCDQILLLLYIRVTLFQFSMKLGKTSENLGDSLKMHRKSDDLGKWIKEIRVLRRLFTRFENLFQFPTFSNQEQAIEMYSIARRHMDIDDLYKEVSGEIRSTDDLIDSELDRNRNVLAESLNVIAFFGLLASIALAWMGAHQSNQTGLSYFMALLAISFVYLTISTIFTNPINQLLQFQNSSRDAPSTTSIKKSLPIISWLLLSFLFLYGIAILFPQIHDRLGLSELGKPAPPAPSSPDQPHLPGTHP